MGLVRKLEVHGPLGDHLFKAASLFWNNGGLPREGRAFALQYVFKVWLQHSA